MKHSLYVIAIAVLVGVSSCNRAQNPISKVNIQEAIKNKSRVLPDQHEVVPMTYFELAAISNEPMQTTPRADATAAVAAGTKIACIEARAGKNWCHITLAQSVFNLSVGEMVEASANGSVSLSCAGDAQGSCKAWAIHL